MRGDVIVRRTEQACERLAGKCSLEQDALLIGLEKSDGSVTLFQLEGSRFVIQPIGPGTCHLQYTRRIVTHPCCKDGHGRSGRTVAELDSPLD